MDEVYRGADGGVPAGFAAVRAVICDTESRTLANGAETTVAVEQTATDLEALLTALSQPSQTAVRGDLACPAMAWVEPWLFLVDARNRWIHPHFPLTACHLPRPGVTAALEGLQKTSVVLRTLRVDTSASAVKAGCTQSWKNMITETLDQPGSSPTSARLGADPFRGAELRRCVYRTGTGQAQESFERGGVLTGSERQRLVDGLTSADAAATTSCAAPAETFALLRRTDGQSPTLYVELGGCRRILVTEVGPETVSIGGQALVDLLAT